MLPLNKPCFSNLKQPDNSFELYTEIEKEFSGYYIYFIFSARQGLEIIYSYLYSKFGKCRVAVSPLTCFDALLPIINNGHELIFVDIDVSTLNMSEIAIPINVDIIQAIHFGGNPQEMKKIITRSAIIIEDCAQAYGAFYEGKRLGSFSDYSTFSFYKNLYSLGGGFILSKEVMSLPYCSTISELLIVYRKVKMWLEAHSNFHSFFIYWILQCLIRAKNESLSVNFSKLQINSSIYNSMRKQFFNRELLLMKRKEIAHKIIDRIDPDIMKVQKPVLGAEPIFTRLLFVLEKHSSYESIIKLRKYGIGANHLTQNLLTPYQQDIYNNTILRPYSRYLPVYKSIHDRVISVPISPVLHDEEIEKMTNIINKVLK